MWTRRIARIAAVLAMATAGMAQALEPCGKNHYILDEPCILGWVPANRGLTDPDVHVVAVDPIREKTLYAGGASGIFKSVDGGATWNPAGPMMHLNDSALDAARAQFRNLPAGFSIRAKVNRFAIDNHDPETVYAATAMISGCVWMQRNVFKSTDGGATWTNSIAPPINGCDLVHALVLAPSNPGVVYVGNGDAGDSPAPAIRSFDGGSNWTPLEYLALEAVAVDPRSALTVYGGTSHYENPYTALPTGLLKSEDGGITWTPTALSKTGITAIAIDHRSPQTVYAVTARSPRSADGGLFKSMDGGLSWAPAGDGLGNLLQTTSATALLVDSRDSRNVYLATAQGGVWRSADAAITWSPLNDELPSLAIRSLALISAAPNVLYAATADGVFRLHDVTAAGAPSRSGLNRP